MTRRQRQAAFECLLVSLARKRAESMGLCFAGTIRRLAPPPLPGDAAGATLYYLNAAPRSGGGPSLYELGAAFNAQLQRAEKWVETGQGSAPLVPAAKARKSLKRKV